MKITRLMGWCVPAVLMLLAASPLGCGVEPIVQGDIFAGLQDLLEGAEPVSTFDGEWLSTEYGYAFEITDRTGLVTITNTAVLDVGDVILVIATVDGPGFTGRHIFTDGSIRDIVGRLTNSDTLFLSDGELSWTLSRSSTNLAPVADAQLVTTSYETPVTITLTGQDLDNGPAALTFTVLTFPGDGQLTGTAPTLTYTPVVGFVGTDTFTFRVSDGADQSSAATVTISVGSDNRPPSVDAGSNMSITLPTNFVDLDGTASDDGRPSGVLTTSWSRVDGPESASFADSGAVDTTVTFGLAGTYVLQLEVSDGPITVTDTVTIFVHAQ